MITRFRVFLITITVFTICLITLMFNSKSVRTPLRAPPMLRPTTTVRTSVVRKNNNTVPFSDPKNKRLTIISNREWSPPEVYNQKWGDYLIYKSELDQALSRPLLDKKCPTSTKVVIIVCSAYFNYDHRNSIRQTWAKVAPLLDTSVYFVIGTSKIDLANRSLIIEEDRLFRDLIQFDFVDNYKNLTMKVVAGLNSTSTNCQSAYYVIKTDDDMYLDLEQLVNELNQLNHNSNSIYGFQIWPGNFNRDPKNYHYVPKEIYAPKTSPPYFVGWLQIYERDSLRKILEITLNSVPLLFIEDVFLTGFMAQKANVKKVPLNHRIAQFNCDLIKHKDFGTKIIIGDKCKPDDQFRIFDVKTKLNHNTGLN